MAMVILGLLVSLMSISNIAFAADKEVQQVDGGAGGLSYHRASE